MKPLLFLLLLGSEPARADALDDRLAAGMDDWLESGIQVEDFATGSGVFNAEWVFGSYQMAALGYGQHALAHPEARAADLSRMERCIDAMLSPAGRAFDVAHWREDPMEALAGDRGHMAWLGYLDLVLSFHRQLDPTSKYAGLNDRITDALARRIAADPTGIPETYPGERYPVDTSAGASAIGLYDRVTGADHSELLARWTALFSGYRDPATGLLHQSIRADGSNADVARGSGTFLAAYYLSFSDRVLGQDLYRSGHDHLYQDVYGFGAMREYPAGQEGNGDIDSGPIVAGLGMSSTGFAIAMAHRTGDEATFRSLVHTTEMFGAPFDHDGKRHWKSGAAFGGAAIADAILFAMITAGPLP